MLNREQSVSRMSVLCVTTSTRPSGCTDAMSRRADTARLGGLIRIFAAGHWISRRIGFEASDFIGEKLLGLDYGLALNTAEVDLAQAVVNARLKSRRTRRWGSRFAGAIQRRAPDCGQSCFGCPGPESLGLRIAARVQCHFRRAGIAVISVPDRPPMPNEEELCHEAALWWACCATAPVTQPRRASSSTSRRYGSRKRPAWSGRG